MLELESWNGKRGSIKGGVTSLDVGTQPPIFQGFNDFDDFPVGHWETQMARHRKWDFICVLLFLLFPFWFCCDSCFPYSWVRVCSVLFPTSCYLSMSLFSFLFLPLQWFPFCILCLIPISFLFRQNILVSGEPSVFRKTFVAAIHI